MGRGRECGDGVVVWISGVGFGLRVGLWFTITTKSDLNIF